MKLLSFNCQTITPMAMSGADKDKIELRPPSFKGALRFWWRALHGNLSLKDLRKNEGKVFGASDEDIGKSKINIKINPKKIEENDHWRYQLRNDKETGDERKRFPQPAIKPGFPFNVVFNYIDNAGLDISNLFQLVSILSGFGRRSRRGFGSIEIIKIDNVQYSMPIEPNEILDKILKLINSINFNKYIIDRTNQKIIKNFSQPIPPNEYPFIEEIEIGKEYKTDIELLKAIGQASHDFNCEHTGTPIPTVRDRFASPVYVSVVKVNSNYRPIITTLACCPERPLRGQDKSKDFKEAILR